MKLTELFEHNKNIVINTDIDGILSGLILVKYCKCQIVGFTNSKDKVWLAPGHNDLYGNVYVDMFVADERVTCIDQHIVAINDAHMQSIRNRNNIHSPQSDDINNLRVFSTKGFKKKYPFGTIHYLIAKLESEGISVTLPDLKTIVDTSLNIRLGDLLLRADDAMKTTLNSPYTANAQQWWNWLKSLSNKAVSIQTMIDFLNTDVGNVDNIKNNTREYFKQHFQCRTSDGGFKEITDGTGALKPYINHYIRTVAGLLNVKRVKIPPHYIVHQGTYCRTRWLDIFANDFIANGEICGHKLFSYAFIYGPDNDSHTNFSFTIDMN